MSALFAVSLLLLGNPVSVRAKAPPVPKTFDVEAIDAYLAGQVKERGYVGLSVALLRDGKLVFARGYGKSSLKDDTAVDKDTRFGIGSVTKQFTCACILLLAEDGKLDVHDKVARWYPDLTRAGDITLYDLMTHTSGYPDYYPLDFVDRRLAKPIAPDKLLQEYAGGKLDFEPGTHWSYSNTGYVLLGRVVEKVSGEPFGAFLERRVLKQLGMEQTVFEPKDGGKDCARGYTSFALGDPEPATVEGKGWAYTAGAIYATPSDLVKWDQALMEGKLLKPQSYQLMTTARKLTTGKTKSYGCGLMIAQIRDEALFTHGGAVSGFLAQNTFLPGTKSAVALLVNADHVNVNPVHNALVALLLEQGGPNREPPKVTGLSPQDAARKLLGQLAKGEVDRDQLGEEYSAYLSDERLQAAAARLKPLGEPTDVEVSATQERGGMEVAVVRFIFKTTVLKALLYRTPDGKVQEFLLNKD